MQKKFIIVAILLIGTCFQSNARQKVDTLISKQNRTQILDVLRTLSWEQIGVRTKFVVQTIQKANNWVLIQVHPVQENGADINYKKTKYYPAHKEQMEDFFDDHILALMKFEHGKWHIVEYEIGATDFPGQEWLEKHGIAGLFK